MGRRAAWQWMGGRHLSLALPALLVVALVALLAAIQSFSWTLDRSLDNGSGTLRLVTAALASHLERYEALPPLVADRPELLNVLSAPQDEDRVRLANAYLKELSERLSVSDIYVMLPSGLTIAASNHDGPASFIGQNFRFRPYFQAAAEGSQGRFFGLGTTSNKRGYYFSDPIRIAGRVVGILAFKIDLDPIEATWASNDTEILVLDTENFVFMAGRPEWRYHAFGPVEATALERSLLVRRYAQETVEPLALATGHALDGREVTAIEEDGARREFLVLSRAMPTAGWTVTVLVNTAPATRQALAIGLAVFFLLALALFAAAAEQARRRRTADRLAAEAAAKQELELRVEERTRALALANGQLQREIGERRGAEARLRRTQSDLVEAGKLAALGQMSAALSHEFNQPLAAASAYADNAAVFLERGAVAQAGENVARIADLLSRLSSISRHLRNFARRPDEALAAVNLRASVDEALAIVGHRVSGVGAEVEIDPALAQLEVRGVAVRLQQVLVNLLSNAADAVEGVPTRCIRIGARRTPSNGVELTVEDSGPGVPAAIAPRIFDPFFTSKAVGKGLGLGLSISYNILRDFGGHLRLERSELGGARFVVELQSADAALLSAAE